MNQRRKMTAAEVADQRALHVEEALAVLRDDPDFAPYIRPPSRAATRNGPTRSQSDSKVAGRPALPPGGWAALAEPWRPDPEPPSGLVTRSDMTGLRPGNPPATPTNRGDR